MAHIRISYTGDHYYFCNKMCVCDDENQEIELEFHEKLVFSHIISHICLVCVSIIMSCMRRQRPDWSNHFIALNNVA